MDPFEQQLKSLIDIGRLFEQRQWVLGTSGNMSVRLCETPLTFAITATGLDKGNLDRRSFLVIDSDGKQVESDLGSNKKDPSRDHLIHAAIYKSCHDAACILHVHIVSGLLMADLFESAGRADFEGMEVLKGLGSGNTNGKRHILIGQNGSEGRLAENISSLFQKPDPNRVPAVLAPKHGMYVWGDSPQTARRHVELLVHVFDYFILKRALSCSTISPGLSS